MRFGRAPAVAKNLDALTTRGGEVAHVFHDAQQRHVHALKHRDAFAHYAERCLLRCGHHHAAIERHRLAKGQLRVACARRQIHQQIIQRAPIYLQHKLLDGFHDHRPAPNHRLIALQQEAHAHQLHAVVH